jgi:ABC-type multidrug transport system fused ATPase/permease subunit
MIKSKEKIGIVGRTGSGKSTILLALLRVLEATNGNIFIDGTNIKNLDLTDLRKNLTLISQEPTLFENTLRANLDPEQKHTDS